MPDDCTSEKVQTAFPLRGLTMLRSPHFRLGIAISALVVALFTTVAARAVNASAVEGSATIHDGLAQVSFKIEISNTADSAMTNTFVVFEDGTEVSIGDVAGGSTVQSEQQSRTVDMGDNASRSVSMKATLKY